MKITMVKPFLLALKKLRKEYEQRKFQCTAQQKWRR